MIARAALILAGLFAFAYAADEALNALHTPGWLHRMLAIVFVLTLSRIYRYGSRRQQEEEAR